jgi:hypothetical protein
MGSPSMPDTTAMTVAAVSARDGAEARRPSPSTTAAGAMSHHRSQTALGYRVFAHH